MDQTSLSNVLIDSTATVDGLSADRDWYFLQLWSLHVRTASKVTSSCARNFNAGC